MRFVQDDGKAVSWIELQKQIEKQFSFRGVQFIDSENSMDYAAKLFAAADGAFAAVLLNTRWSRHEKDSLIESLRDEKLASGIYVATSGSEGKPKLAHLTGSSLYDHAKAVCEHLQVTDSDIWLACLPFYHVGGLAILFRCKIAEASVRILAGNDAETINQIIESGKITLISLVNTTLKRLLDLRNDKPFPKHLRAIIVGGGPVPDDVIDRCPVALPTYGLTEAGSMLTCARPKADDDERHSAGLPLPGVELKIINENNQPCALNETGIIHARTPGLFSGYVNDKKKTAAAMRDGWLVTNDFGYLDEKELLHVVARRDDLILSGGENIRPREIETAIRMHPDVTDCVVLSLTDSDWGQIAAAFVVKKPQSDLTEEILFLFLRQRLAPFKLPKKIMFSDAVPLLSTGKIDREKIRKMFQ